MKLIIPLVLCAAAGASTFVTDAPSCVSTLTLPDGTLDLRLAYRQVSGDLTGFREGEGLTARELHELRVTTLLAFGGRLDSDVHLRIGEHVLRPGSYPLGFTVAVGGGMRFFLIDGTEALPLAFDPLEPGWEAPRLSLQLHYVDRGEALLVWHLGAHAGRATVHLGSERTPAGPGDAAPRER